MDDHQHVDSNSHQKTDQNRSEYHGEHSEPRRVDAEPFGMKPVVVPNSSEQRPHDFRTVPNNSEQLHLSVPNSSEPDRERSEGNRTEPDEPHRTAPTCSTEHGDYTITVREAARIFDDAGVPRTERAITNWCNRNARGTTRLACCYNEADRKYLITPESIQRVITEERQKIQYREYQVGGTFSSDAEDLSEQVRNERMYVNESVQNGSERHAPDMENVRNSSERSQNVSEAFRTAERKVPNGSVHEAERSEYRRAEIPKNSTYHTADTGSTEGSAQDDPETLKELQMENYNLKVQLEGQKYLVRKFDDLIAGERERHEREKLALVDRLTDARHEIGALEQKLLQLEAPKGTVRDADVGEAQPWRKG